MKHITTIFTLILIVGVPAACAAQRPNLRGQRQQQDGMRQQREGLRRQRNAQRQQPVGQRQRPQGQRQRANDPGETAEQMMREFDKNGDQKLDRGELTAMFTSMRERRLNADPLTGQGGRDQGRQRAARSGPDAEPADADAQQRTDARRAAGRTRRRDNEPNAAGGVEPKRPGSE